MDNPGEIGHLHANQHDVIFGIRSRVATRIIHSMLSLR